MSKKVQTIIVGGGQAGLSLSHLLAQNHHEHIILEKAPYPASAWRDGRWDSFTLVTPNWTFRLPGGGYEGDQPDGFLPRAEIVATFETYIQRNHLPIQYDVTVTSVEPVNGGYLVKTGAGDYHSENVVVATGLFQQPKIPDFSTHLPPDVLQIHSGQYRNPEALPPGAILVVGSAQSGCQIAEELYQSGRTVYLCVGQSGRAPRRYRGRDTYEWLYLNGFLSRTVAQLPSAQARFASNPHLSGKNGGHGLNLHRFARDGVRLLGRLMDTSDGRIHLLPDLREKLAWADEFEVNITRMIDAYIAQNGITAPEEKLETLRDGFDSPLITELNLKSMGISTIIWALGYRFDFSMVRLPVLDEAGFPRSQSGETGYKGLYFHGLPWLPSQITGFLLGVEEASVRLASMIVPGFRAS